MSDQDLRHAELLQARYGNQDKPTSLIWSPVVEQQISHKSVRTFRSESLPEGALETIVAAAQSASTSGALHLWSLVAVTDVALKKKLNDVIAPTCGTDEIPWISEAPALLLWVADSSRSAEIAQQHGAEPVVLEYLDSILMASIDTSLAAQNAALAAESIGLGIVFLGVMRNASEQVAEIIGLPSHSFVLFGMALGHPDPDRTSAPRPRLPQAAVLHLNTYQAGAYRKHIDGYEEAYLQFRTQQKMKPKTWQSGVLEIATSMPYMGGRENLSTTVKERGFKLR